MSPRFKRLNSRLKALEQHLLPVKLSPTGTYSARESDLVRSYVLLVHAEIEAYFEDRARSRVDRAFSAWEDRQVWSPVLSRLMVYHQARSGPWKPTAKLADNVQKAVNFYITELRQNHGIKAVNLLSIFLPLGLSHDDFDTGLLATLDSFGFLRGKLAHESIKTHQPIDPKTERDKIHGHIMREVRKLDRKIGRLI